MEDLDKDSKVDDDYSSTKQVNGKVNWIVDKGIWLGKKAVITGAVISSAPLVLPPLVVFSTLGLACSVPFGFVFATYAFTQKIMSKLLPTPELSSMLDYEKYNMEVVDLVQGAGAVKEGYDTEDVNVVQGAVAQVYDDLLQQVEEQGYEEEDDNLVERAGEQGYEQDEEEEPEEQEMKDTSGEVVEGDILQEKPIDTTEFVVTSIELDGRNNVLPEGTALSQEDVLYGQDGIQIYNEEPLEQDNLTLEVLKGTGMKNVHDDATTGMDIYKQKPVVEEKELKEGVEGDATIIELTVNDISEPEGGHSYQACVYDGINSFAVLKEESDDMKRRLLVMSDIHGEARNETREPSISQGNENYEDTTKYLQVDNLLSVKGTEVRNEKLVIEDMNEKPVIEMRQVIVSVHGGKIAAEQESEDVKECNKLQKLVLVAKKVTEETVGDIKSVIECKNTLGDLSLAREIADECGMDLFDYTAGDYDSYNDFNISQENDNIRKSKTDDVADLPVGVSTKEAESEHTNPLPETGLLTPSNEELLNEEKIWEQIDALRAIVGYSAPMHTTAAEEIKALYIFTGVEPPPSFAENSDLEKMNEKLRLLKSVVGVK